MMCDHRELVEEDFPASIELAVRACRIMFARIVHGRDTDIPVLLEKMPDSAIDRLPIDVDVYLNKMTFQGTDILEQKLFKKICKTKEAASANTKVCLRTGVTMRVWDLSNYVSIMSLLVADVCNGAAIPDDTTGVINADPLVLLCAKLRDYCVVYGHLLTAILKVVTGDEDRDWRLPNLQI